MQAPSRAKAGGSSWELLLNLDYHTSQQKSLRNNKKIFFEMCVCVIYSPHSLCIDLTPCLLLTAVSPLLLVG